MLVTTLLICEAAFMVAFETLLDTEEAAEAAEPEDDELEPDEAADPCELPMIGNEFTRLFRRTKLVFNRRTFCSLFRERKVLV